MNGFRTQAQKMLIANFTMKAAASTPATLATQIGTTALTAEDGKWVLGFMVKSPLAWRYGHNSGHTAPTVAVAAYEEYEPPLCGRKEIDALYVRSGTGGAATTATIHIYLGDRDGI